MKRERQLAIRPSGTARADALVIALVDGPVEAHMVVDDIVLRSVRSASDLGDTVVRALGANGAKPTVYEWAMIRGALRSRKEWLEHAVTEG